MIATCLELPAMVDKSWTSPRVLVQGRSRAAGEVKVGTWQRPSGFLARGVLWAFLFALLLLGIGKTSYAQTRVWTNGGGGSFTNASNWQPSGQPGSADVALFGSGGAYTVTFPSDIGNYGVVITNYYDSALMPAVTFDLGQHTYTQSYGVVVGGKVGDHALLEVANGRLVASSAAVGYYDQSVGTLRILDQGTLSVGGLAVSGNGGTGTLEIQAGGTVVVNWMTEIAGNLTMSGGSFQARDLFLYGASQLNCTGGTISASSLANPVQAWGMASFQGPTARLESAGDLYVGGPGAGTLSVGNGATILTRANAVIAPDGNRPGTVTVAGPASSWSVWGNLIVGSVGLGTLNIQSAGQVASINDVVLGPQGYGRVFVADAGSALTVGRDLIIGINGFAEFTLSGGDVEVTRETLVRKTLQVTGGSLTTHDLTVVSGSYFSLTGGTVAVDGGALTLPSGAGLTVDGPSTTNVPTLQLLNGAATTIAGQVNIANTGTGRLEILGNATASMGVVGIGLQAGSSGSVLVRGADSRLEASGVMVVGSHGVGNLTIDQGAEAVAQTFAVVGDLSDSQGAVTISGAGSQWTTHAQSFVGGIGGGRGSVDVQAGGKWAADQHVTLGVASGAIGQVTVGGAGAEFSAGQSLIVRNSVSSVTLNPGGTIDVAGATDISGSLVVRGGSLTTSSLIIQPTGTLSFSGGTISVEGGSYQGGPLMIDDPTGQNTPVFRFLNPPQTTNLPGVLVVGGQGKGRLEVLDHYTLYAHSLVVVGDGVGSSGQILVQGALTQFVTTQGTFIGGAGTGRLEIRDGASVSTNAFGNSATETVIGATAGSQGDIVVQGNDSALTTTGTFRIGDFGSGSLSIEDGAVVTSNGDAIVRGRLSGHGEATVTGANSQWNVSGTLIVGTDDGSSSDPEGIARLAVSGGGRVSATTVWIGPPLPFPAAQLAEITVDGGTLAANMIYNRGKFSNLAGGTVEVVQALAAIGDTTNDGTVRGLVTVGDSGVLRGSGLVDGKIYVWANGTLAPGASPGTLHSASGTLDDSGRFELEVNDADGAAGAPLGHDLWAMTGSLEIVSTPAAPFVISLVTLDPADNAPGLLTDFDPTHDYAWTFITSGGITGFDPDLFTVDASGFQNDVAGGLFTVIQSGNDLVLTFSSAVPEPASSVLAILAALGASHLVVVRRRPGRGPHRGVTCRAGQRA
jgi:fibronectin-binding autotransporter adhesin